MYAIFPGNGKLWKTLTEATMPDIDCTDWCVHVVHGYDIWFKKKHSKRLFKNKTIKYLHRKVLNVH